MIRRLYQDIILSYPLLVLSLFLSALIGFGYFATKLEIDASADTLLLEDDKDLAFSREVSRDFKTDSFLVITYSPKLDILDDQTLKDLRSITLELERLPLVSSVTSILNVPLLFSPPKELKELVDGVTTLQKDSPKKELVREEFLTNPLYKDSLVSSDFKTTAILISLEEDREYFKLLNSKDKRAFKSHRDKRRLQESQNIAKIRSIMKKYESSGVLFLGGVSMIANDIVSFVKSDLFIYGLSLVIILVVVLWVIFRAIRWVILPISISALSVLAITSCLGFFGWEITVISSNFIALQLIITISIVIHLIVRYNELLTLYPRASHSRIILYTMLTKFIPITFAIITTIAGFSSLVVSGIKPVINLGWMMSAGIFMSFIVAYIVFPTLLIKLSKLKPTRIKRVFDFSFTRACTDIVKRDKKAIFVVTILTVVFTLSGATMLIVENSFINYFKKDTEIYKGMKVIDQELGGTTPLDIVLTFKKYEESIETTSTDIDDFEDEFSTSEDDYQYWFTKEKMDIIIKIDNYLKGIDSIGSVHSLATILDIGKRLNGNQELDGFTLALLYNNLPQKYKALILSPYINIEKNQVRFSTRIKDSDKNLRRSELLSKIQKDISTMIDPKVATFKLSNLMVLYNNMLQSLFDSQIKTLALVLLVVAVMFLILFRSIKIAIIALIINIVPVSIVFGIMGWLGIALDIMTITIAAISIGIAVDNTIHYIHRFIDEFSKDGDYIGSVQRSGRSIGSAMYYTSLTIMIGFSILTLSNLLPTIYFGLLTMVVMISALLADIILLPRLFLLFRPLSKL
jgi:predicted RND superfamily exporter protein